MSVSLTVIAGLVATLTRSVHSARSQISKSRGLEPGSSFLIKELVANGDMRSSELTERACVDAAVVSRQIKSLIASGLVERIPDPLDGRASLIHLTDEGAALFKHSQSQQQEFFERVFADWSEADQRKFEKLFSKFVTDLNREVQAMNQIQEVRDGRNN